MTKRDLIKALIGGGVFALAGWTYLWVAATVLAAINN